MVNGLRKVVPGQPMGAGFPAATYNAMVDVINAYRRGRLTMPSQNKNTIRTAGIVLVKNATGTNLSRGQVIGLDTPIVGPQIESGGPYWHQVALTGITPTADHVPDVCAIARESIPSGKIGYATISGACQTRVYMQSSTHTCAACQAGNTSYLQSRMNGGARIIWVSSTATGIQDAVVRLADTPEVGVVRVDGTSGEAQNPYYSNFFAGKLVQFGVASPAENIWIVPVNSLDSVTKLRGQEQFIGLRAGMYDIGGDTRELYYIYEANIGKVRVNADDGLDFLEDQFADHVSSPTYASGDLIVASETVAQGDDQLIRAFVQTTGYNSSYEQALTHDSGSESLVWVDVVEVDVITDLRISSGRIEKKVSKVKVLSNQDQGWMTGLQATTCPEPY